MKKPTLEPRARIALFYARLEKAPPCRNATEALTLIIRMLDAVEDEWSGVPKNPQPPLRFEGRLYPPQSDFTEHFPDGSAKAVTRRHEILLSAQGGIRFVHRATRIVEFRKAGAENADPI